MTTHLNITDAQILKLAEDHVSRYNRMLSSWIDNRNACIRPDECLSYLGIWMNIQNKGGRELTALELNEVRDAIESGDYDGLLGNNNTKNNEVQSV